MNTRRKAGNGGKKRPASIQRPDAKRTGPVTSARRAAAQPVKAATRKLAPRPAKSAGRQRAASSVKQPAPESLAADCTISQVADIKARLDRVLTQAGAVSLDLSAVRRIDTAGLQLLAAFIRERRAAGRQVRCEGATESFQMTASLLGLGTFFSAPVDERLSQPAAGHA